MPAMTSMIRDRPSPAELRLAQRRLRAVDLLGWFAGGTIALALVLALLG
jgi:hypothetical protein